MSTSAAFSFHGLVVCMVGPHHPRPGGVTIQVETLSRCLARDGVEVRAVDTNVQRVRQIGKAGRRFLPLAQLGMVPWRLWRASRGAALIHVHLASYWGFYLPMLAIASLPRRIPVVASYHGGLARQFVADQQRWVQPLFRRIDALVTSSQAIAAAFEPLSVDAVILPNVLEFHTPPKRAHIAGEPPRLLWIKRFDRSGNPLLMVRAYAMARRAFPDLRLAMVGVGPLLEQAQALADHLAAPVDFAGRISDEALAQAYASADLFVSSSAVDNQPNTVLEASSAGLPIVATAVGGVPEMVHDGVDALLTPPDDPHRLAEAIVRVLRHPALAAQLAAAAQANAQRFTWPAVRPQVADVYRRVLRG